MRIKEVRLSKHWSQVELAAKCVPAISTDTLHRLENGGGVLESTFNRVCDALGVDPLLIEEKENIVDPLLRQKKGETK